MHEQPPWRRVPCFWGSSLPRLSKQHKVALETWGEEIARVTKLSAHDEAATFFTDELIARIEDFIPFDSPLRHDLLAAIRAVKRKR